MAITVDGSPVNTTGSGSSVSVSYTVSGTNPVVIALSVGTTSDNETSASFNGTNLPLIGKIQNNNGLGRYVYMWGGAVSSGTGNVTVNYSGSADFMSIAAVAYYGVGSIGTGSTTNTAGNVTSLAQSQSTSAAGGWLTWATYNDGASGTTAGSNTTLRVAVTPNPNNALLDSGGSVGAAGSHTLNCNLSSGHISAVIVNLEAAVTANHSNFLAFM